MGLLRQFLLDVKIYHRIHSRYRRMFPGSSIASLLPPQVEKRISRNTVIEKEVSITSAIEHIGRGLFIGKRTAIMSCRSIGAFTSISSDVKVGLMSHPAGQVSTSPVFYTKRRGWLNSDTYAEDEGKTTVIGNDVLISANAMIRNGVTVGDGAIVGAGAFVNEDVPPYAIVAGVPAKIIRYRFDEATIKELLALKWWDKDDELIKKAGHFNDPVKFIAALKALCRS